MRYRNYKRSFIKPKKEISGIERIERRILAVEILDKLEENGFVRCQRLETKYGDNSEIVYVKPLPENKRYFVAVYTSCNQSGGAFIARAKGKDAIRVAGLYIKKDGSAVGVIKNTRVNRTSTPEAICERMINRISKSFVQLRASLQSPDNFCVSCGAPNFISKKGNSVCSELCWR